MTRDGAERDPGNGRDEEDGVDRPHADEEREKDDLPSSAPEPHDEGRAKDNVRSSPPDPHADAERDEKDDLRFSGSHEDRERHEDPDPGITPHIDGSTSTIPGRADVPPASRSRAPSERIAAIALRDVTFAYGEGPPVLDGASVEILPGLTLLVGPNGCGKSTFMRLAAGVELPEEGRVLVEGLDLWKDEARARLRLAYVPEQPDLTPYASIREVLKLVARLRGEPLAVVDRMLETTGLTRLGRRSVRALSLGQRRRVLLAAAMIGRPPVLLLDEPLEAMDRSMRELIVAWVLERCREGATAVVATHEFEGFETAAERVLTIEEGAATMVDPLPPEPDERRAVIERLARGRAGATPAFDQAAPVEEDRAAAVDEAPREGEDHDAVLDGPRGDESATRGPGYDDRREPPD